MSAISVFQSRMVYGNPNIAYGLFWGKYNFIHRRQPNQIVAMISPHLPAKRTQQTLTLKTVDAVQTYNFLVST